MSDGKVPERIQSRSSEEGLTELTSGEDGPGHCLRAPARSRTFVSESRVLFFSFTNTTIMLLNEGHVLQGNMEEPVDEAPSAFILLIT